MPSIITDAVVVVNTEEGEVGEVVASGPGDATVAGEEERMDADVAAAKQARYISAFEPQAQDLNQERSGAMEVVSLMRQLEELDKAAQRSVAAEVESALESGACLVDESGRARILALCQEIRRSCEKLSRSDMEATLHAELQKAVAGEQPW